MCCTVLLLFYFPFLFFSFLSLPLSFFPPPFLFFPDDSAILPTISCQVEGGLLHPPPPLWRLPLILFRLQGDLLTAIDQRKKAMFFILLDFSAAFNVIDRLTLFESQPQPVGFAGNVLRWIRSYLHDRSHDVKNRRCSLRGCS